MILKNYHNGSFPTQNRMNGNEKKLDLQLGWLLNSVFLYMFLSQWEEGFFGK